MPACTHVVVLNCCNEDVVVRRIWLVLGLASWVSLCSNFKKSRAPPMIHPPSSNPLPGNCYIDVKLLPSLDCCTLGFSPHCFPRPPVPVWFEAGSDAAPRFETIPRDGPYPKQRVHASILEFQVNADTDMNWPAERVGGFEVCG